MAETLRKSISRHLLLARMPYFLPEIMKFSVLLLIFSLQAILVVQKRDPIFCSLTISCLVLVAAAKRWCSFPSPVYLLDFSCMKPPDFCRTPFSSYIEHSQMMKLQDKESVAFMAKVLAQSGQGERTYLPPAMALIPPGSSHEAAVKEVHLVLFPVIVDLLSKTKVSPAEIDVLIVNCSGFCPVPSLSSIVINRFSMKEDIKSFTISGMGCSASALAIDMAQNLLKTRKNSTAMILSTEILSTGWYPGKEQPMLVLNCVFRMGAAAILVTNKKEARTRAKYKLVRSLRSQRAFDDIAYHSAFREEDGDGFTGVTLRRDLIQVAGETLRSNISILGSKILPFSEMLSYAISILKKKYMHKSTEIYVPNFKSVVEHFCLPASGKPVIREIAKGLRLGEENFEPALMTLHRFGNQSSSSIWYELSYLESKERVKKGDKVWQLGMGSGPKCTSLIWKCIRPISGEAQNGVWADCIHDYPVVTLDKRTSLS